MSKKVKIIGILLVGVLLVVASINYVFYGGARDLAAEEAEFTLSSKAITGEFVSNVAKATLKYSDKAIVISGKVTAVSDSTVTIDNTIICNFNQFIAIIKCSIVFQQSVVFVFFVMAVAAAEVAVGLAILSMIYRNIKSIDSDLLRNLKNQFFKYV